jgi:glutamyl-tRNA synthetase
LPLALRNYLGHLGWWHGDEEAFTLEQMIAAFDIHDANEAKSPSKPL